MNICNFFVLSLLLMDGGVWSLRNVSISVPRAALSGAAQAAVLRCEYELEGAALYSLRWYRADTEFYRYVPREHPPTMVFPLPGTTVDLTQSDSKQVRLVGLHRRLSGVYQCEVSADAPLFHTDIRSAPLTIIDPPFMAPRVWVSRESYSRGSALRANCSIDEAYPPPNITWTLDDVPIAHAVSAPPSAEDFREKAVTSELHLTFTDDITYNDVTSKEHTSHNAGVYYTDGRRKMEVTTSILRATLPLSRVSSKGGAALRCVAEILEVYSRPSTPMWLREDAPAHASVTRPVNHGSVAARLLASGAFWILPALTVARVL